jgi:hypothetical protein
VELYIIIIIIIIGTGTATCKKSWPPSEVFSTLLDSWPLPTSSLFSASLHPFPLHLTTWRAVLALLTHQTPRHTDLFNSCNMTTSPQPSSFNYHRESGLFKEVVNFFIAPTPPLISVRNRAIYSSYISFLWNTATLSASVRDNTRHSAPYNIMGRTKVL